MVKFRYLRLFLVISAVVVFLDQITKWIFEKFQPSIEMGIVKLHLIYNTGAGFGILQGKTVWLGLLSLAVAVGISLYYKKVPQQWLPQILVGLFFGGVVGNMLDRFLRGQVIDFIDFTYWPAFNIADTALTVSAIGLIIYFWNEKTDQKQSNQKQSK